LTLIVPRFLPDEKNSTAQLFRDLKKASSCCFGAGGDFSGMRTADAARRPLEPFVRDDHNRLSQVQ
jgi:hypothetical protein